MKAKISASHLERRACVYIRQSTTHQMFQHAESTRRQHGLAERAMSLGWSKDSIEVIDEDQGRSGASSDGRTGFTRLVDAIAHGQVDIPKRTTQVRIAWKSGAVSELIVERPEHGRVTPRFAAKRVQELSASRLHDAEVATQLNSEGIRTGADRPWTACAVAWVRSREKIPSTALPVRSKPTPDRDSRGRFSVAGAARYFEVSMHVIRAWIYAGRVKAERESCGSHHDVLWLTINRATERRLKSYLERTANRYPRLVPPPQTEAKATENSAS